MVENCCSRLLCPSLSSLPQFHASLHSPAKYQAIFRPFILLCCIPSFPLLWIEWTSRTGLWTKVSPNTVWSADLFQMKPFFSPHHIFCTNVCVYIFHIFIYNVQLFLSPDWQKEHDFGCYLAILFFNSSCAMFSLNWVARYFFWMWFVILPHPCDFLQQFLLLNMRFFWHVCPSVRSQLILHHEVQMTPRCWPLDASFVFPGLSGTSLAFSISPTAYIFSLYMASVYRIWPRERRHAIFVSLIICNTVFLFHGTTHPCQEAKVKTI